MLTPEQREVLADAVPHADWCCADAECGGCDCERYRRGIVSDLLPVIEQMFTEWLTSGEMPEGWERGHQARVADREYQRRVAIFGPWEEER